MSDGFLLTASERYFFDQEAVREKADWDRWGVQTTEKYEGTASKVGWMQTMTREQIMAKIGSRRVRPTDLGGGNQAKGTIPFDGATRNVRSVWDIATRPYSEAHFATFPIEIPRRCIAAGSPAGGSVLDPFMGSGTTALAARGLGRKAIGVELNPEYAALASRRLGQQSLLAEDAA